MNDLPCEASLEELRQDALAHYEELANKAVHWSSIVPDAINYYYDCKAKERDATQEEVPQKRYFIVSYLFHEKDGSPGLGNCGVINQNGNYLNRDTFLLKSGYSNLVIISIQEISEKDYQDYSSKKEE